MMSTATATEVLMPKLSDSMEEGTILSWLVAPGAEVTVYGQKVLPYVEHLITGEPPTRELATKRPRAPRGESPSPDGAAAVVQAMEACGEDLGPRASAQNRLADRTVPDDVAGRDLAPVILPDAFEHAVSQLRKELDVGSGTQMPFEGDGARHRAAALELPYT